MEGVEYLLLFDHIISGLRKQGVDLSEVERDAICGAVTSEVTCPTYIRRLAADHGAASISAAFYMSNQPTDLTMEVLLRRYKGDYYRRRYPMI